MSATHHLSSPARCGRPLRLLDEKQLHARPNNDQTSLPVQTLQRPSSQQNLTDSSHLTCALLHPTNTTNARQTPESLSPFILAKVSATPDSQHYLLHPPAPRDLQTSASSCWQGQNQTTSYHMHAAKKKKKRITITNLTHPSHAHSPSLHPFRLTLEIRGRSGSSSTKLWPPSAGRLQRWPCPRRSGSNVACRHGALHDMA